MSDRLQHISALTLRAAERFSECVAILIDELGSGGAGGAPAPAPPVRGVITAASVVSRGRWLDFRIDGESISLKRGVVAETLRVLIEPGSAVARDGQRYHPVAAIAAAVADRLGRVKQKPEAVRATIHRVRLALRELRDDAEDLIVFNSEVRGYRLSRPEPGAK